MYISIGVLFETLLNHWLLASVSIVILYNLGYAIYNLYFHPLAKFPGPFLAKLSGWPNYYYATTGYRHIWIWQCHQIYGSAVRFKPDGVLWNTPSAYRTIHQAKANVCRGPFYSVFARNAQDVNTVNTTDTAIHTRKRKVLNKVFSAEAVRSAEDFVIHHVDRWNELLMQDDSADERGEEKKGGVKEKGWTRGKNMSEWVDCLLFDIMGDLCFGKSFGLMEPVENPFKHLPQTIADSMLFMFPIAHSPLYRFLRWVKPRGFDSLAEIIAPKNVKQYYDFIETNLNKRAEEEKLRKAQGLEKEGRKDMLHYLFNATDDAGNPAYSPEELKAESNMLMIAGTDTTATSIVGFWFHILRYPKVYEKLVEEIRTTFKKAEDIEMGPTLSSCKYLQACIDESLRVAPAACGELAREVQAGGYVIEGSYVPEGTDVGVTGWAIMHNEEHFPDPWVFRPERWMVNPETGVTAEDVARAQAAIMPFSVGQWNCVGQKVAMIDMMIMAARTLWRMDVRLVSGDTVGGGKMELGWGMRSKDQIVLKDAYIALKDGPMAQFRKRIF